MIGQKIAHYSVTGKLGEGGMGEVYRASDSKLGRDVALKVLPPGFVEDEERMSRFAREAKVLAALNHPNIAAIYGLEDSAGQPALVMELVEGDTLADRLKRGGAIDVDEAMRYALQITEALEQAHEQGIVHRDLKPANIKITPEGRIKVLDFGLAKALGDAPAAQSLDDSPTLSLAATQAGIILGTAAYMSPEQAAGQATDRRADIWSFGVVLLEMLTGTSVFTGETVSHTLAAVLQKDPDLDALPKTVPSRIRRMLEHCLAKDPRKRTQAIGDVRLLLEEYIADPESFADAPAAVSTSGRSARPWMMASAALALGLVLALVGLGLTTRSSGSEESVSEPMLALKVELGEQSLFSGSGSSAVISPQGDSLAFINGEGQDRDLVYRPLDQLLGTALPGTTAGYNPFFSPDGQWIGFATSSELKKVAISGGTPLTLCRVSRSRGASWGDDGMIILSPNPSTGLWRVPAAGGEPEELTTLIEGEISHRWPQVLSGARAVLFTAITGSGAGAGSSIEALDLATLERKTVHRGGSYGRYTSSGHLVYANSGTLFAAVFDVDTLEMKGTPAPVLQGVAGNDGAASSQFDISSSGTLVHLQGSSGLREHSILRVDRSGRASVIEDEQRSFAEPRLSPDGRRLAVEVVGSSGSDSWVYDLERGVSTRLTFADGQDSVPIWSPDGQYVVFSSDRGGAPNLYRKRSDGSGQVERLTESEQIQYPSSWSADGRYLLYSVLGGDTGNDLWTLSMDGELEMEPYLVTEFSEVESAFSPDGRWVAYQSDESGQSEVYVRPFPDRGGKWQISVGGGGLPRWSGSGTELFYRTTDGVAAVAITIEGDALRAGTPEVLFQGAYEAITIAGISYADWDVAKDGQSFILFQGEGAVSSRNHVVLMVNWLDYLARTVPVE